MRTMTFAILLLAVGFLTGAAAGQRQLGGVMYVPVDQAVGDIDPSHRSLRQVGSGLRLDGEHTSVFRAVRLDGGALDPFDTPAFIKVGPGYRALVPYMDYAALVNAERPDRLGPEDFQLNARPVIDGAVIELMPAGTIFDLRPINFQIARSPADYDRVARAQNPAARIADKLPDHRLYKKLDLRDRNGNKSLAEIDSPYLRAVEALNEQRRRNREQAAEAAIRAAKAKAEEESKEAEEKSESADDSNDVADSSVESNEDADAQATDKDVEAAPVESPEK